MFWISIVSIAGLELQISRHPEWHFPHSDGTAHITVTAKQYNKTSVFDNIHIALSSFQIQAFMQIMYLMSLTKTEMEKFHLRYMSE